MQKEKVLSQKNSRKTQQRSLILEELKKVNTHPTAEEIYTIVKKRMPRISLGTVYRNLDLLVETGVIRKIDSAGTVRRFDADMSEHVHARCTKCSKVVDIFENYSSKFSLDKTHIEKFLLTSVNIEFEGICHDCAKEQNMAHNF